TASFLVRIISYCRFNSITLRFVSLHSDRYMRTTHTPPCRFRFLYRPEYLSAGTTIVLREGRTRGFGKVISVH
ncbi:unnamed protein product, partial [Laminaria digitata]